MKFRFSRNNKGQIYHEARKAENTKIYKKNFVLSIFRVFVIKIRKMQEVTIKNHKTPK